jgi:GT2 family glycosyltransferase/glycosyltransferase involved in cell wall biosynthesis
VYGGLHVLKTCVSSVLSRTHWDYRLILVEDAGPDPEVVNYLEALKKEHEHVTVLYNDDNRGFSGSVNRGIKAGYNPYVCVLNSDVIVTDDWMVRLLMAMESSEKNVIVNPVTNNTALINVGMYTGQSYLDMDLALLRQSRLKYPEIMPTGFCFAIRRETFEEVGPFDEAYGSYGEETDFWFRTIKATDENGVLRGLKAVMADNCYVFHERGPSFSQLGQDAHDGLRTGGSKRFHSLHSDYNEWSKGFNADDVLGGLRDQIPAAAFSRKYKGNIAWAVKSTGPCGGMFYIADVANELIERGYNVKICLIPDDPNETQPLIGNLRTRPIIFNSHEEFIAGYFDRVFKGESTLLSAVTELTPACVEVAKRSEHVRVFNHVQSWDVDLAEFLGLEALVPKIKEQYKSVPNISCSKWITEEILKLGGEITETISPGVDPDLFHRRGRHTGDSRFTVAVIMLDNYKFKGYDRGVEFCKTVLERWENRVAKDVELRILAIGPESVPEVPGVTALGVLSPTKMADLLGREVDLFVDPSHLHSYGLPALEALASGCRILTWENKGINEYSTIKETISSCCMISADDTDMWHTADDIFEAFMSRELGTEFELPDEHNRIESVNKFISTLFPEVRRVNERAYRIEVISPHMRKHGGPTTLITTANLLASTGHKVSMSMNYADWNPEVINMGGHESPQRYRGSYH